MHRKLHFWILWGFLQFSLQTNMFTKYMCKIDGKCIGDCKNGFYGDLCHLNCSRNCFNSECNKQNGECKSLCNIGYYGPYCNQICSSNCDQNGCEKISGKCTGDCRIGFHGDTCSEKCSPNCASLSCNKSSALCIGDCKNGYYGNFCNRSCSVYCADGKCERFSGLCVGVCLTGYYGNMCQYSCSKNCKFGQCDKNTGQCIVGCLNGFFGTVCNQNCFNCDVCDQTSGACTGECLGGYYSNYCNKSCNVNCKSSLCDKTSGNCKLGCNIGFYGDRCDRTCSSGCFQKSCYRENGSCIYGCTSGRYGQTCDSICSDCSNCDRQTGLCIGCPDGMYGRNCELTCNRNCQKSGIGIPLCNQDTGYCLNGCETGWYGILCDKECNNDIHCMATSGVCERLTGNCPTPCIAGWYGDRCNKTCSVNCNLGVCEKESGKCNAKCKAGFYGDNCDKHCSFCAECDRISGICITCSKGRYGSNCENTCSANCIQQSEICNQTNGVCSYGCVSGWYGSFCAERCNIKCYENTCDRTTGRCNYGCLKGLFGLNCDKTCSNCQNNGNKPNCDFDTGKCLYGCQKRFYGNSCIDLCSENCMNRECSLKGDNCTIGCVDGLYGTGCSSKCNEHCSRGTCLRTSGYCESGCLTGWWGDICNTKCPSACGKGKCQQSDGSCIQECPGGQCAGDDSSLIIIITAAVCGGLFLIIVIVLVAIVIRKKRRKIKKIEKLLVNGEMGHKNEGFTLMHSEGFSNDISYMADIDSISASLPVYATNRSYRFTDTSSKVEEDKPLKASINSKGDNHPSIKVKDLPMYVQSMLAKDRAFEREYATLPRGLIEAHTEAERPENVRKNKYKDICAYDHSRVKLARDDEDSGDYINASYIDGYHKVEAYIAAQGPTEATVNDFWKMVWQLECKSIVMLTNLVEGGVTKCKKYWPDGNEVMTYGSVTVSCIGKDEYADFTVTAFKLEKNGTDHIIKHFQFTSWPDKHVPKFVTPLVEFHQFVRQNTDTWPLLCHCSAGIGRTGTYIALDYLLEQAKGDGEVNIYEFVKLIRHQRVNMINVSDQYRFLHEALVEAVVTSDTVVTKDEYIGYFRKLRNSSGSPSLKSQYQQLLAKDISSDEDAATNQENKSKNRYSNILAPDDCRIYLWSNIKGCNDYINAMYIPTFSNKFAFILTEMPQPRTVIDFCRMLYQEECRTIIMLNNEHPDDKTFSSYWSKKDQLMGCGPFQLKVTHITENSNCKIQTFEFKYKVESSDTTQQLNIFDDSGMFVFKQYQYKDWGEGKTVPNSVSSMLELVDSVEKWQESSGHHPIVVHCMNGAERSGLYLAIASTISRIKSSGYVSLMTTVNQMRARRRYVLPVFEQYSYCHEVIEKYLNREQQT
ncbi:hypothetical protein KUTeg_010739 [Tegillarca granosa]|uniref:protein-tyrosine-phosphatase n=1 Tax=Tegillarca granosa TaxID=220873 RepID=A0ABQ9F222_TEGGR|nr:hypothetical protein KUTeg_010739 [Tegillarca granosa]